MDDRHLVYLPIGLVLSGDGSGGGSTPPIVNPPVLSNNDDLASLTLDGVTLDTPFQATKMAYSADVEFAMRSVDVMATAQNT